MTQDTPPSPPGPPSLQAVEAALLKYWGYSAFLPLQREAIASVLAGRDSLVVLPTGGGKSICFQVPAVVMPGLAIVVSPLISLMKDQVDALTQCGVPAARIDSSLSGSECDAILSRVRARKLRILYVSPERLVTERFIEILRATELSYIAVDEAHCVSMWGHDFRPEYRQLSLLKEVFPGVAIHGYTATATQRVREDIVQQLGLTDPEVLVGSFDRPNLVYRVERRVDRFRQVCEIMDRHKGESGIVYCIRRADVDELCTALREKNYRVASYHAGMDGGERQRSQNAFAEEKVDTIVATVAFGMGIDKSNVRYVIHAGVPQSLEHYQQESGRAGRDGLEAECCLLYSDDDFGLWEWMLRDLEPEPRQIALGQLDHIRVYCTSVACRHSTILDHFDQRLGKDNCTACDVCLGGMETMGNSLEIAQKILSCIVRLQERFGGDYTAAVLTGSGDYRICNAGHDRLSTYGLLREYSKRTVRDWIEQLVAQGCAEKTGEFNVLTVTAKGWRVLKGLETPRLLKMPDKKTKSEDRKARRQEREERLQNSAAGRQSWEGVDRGLFDILRELRRAIADENKIPAFVVFNDSAIRDMARRRPSTLAAFVQVSGVGEKRSVDYGGIFLSAIAEYCRANSVAMDVEPTPAQPPDASAAGGSETSTNLSEARRRAFELFTQGAPLSKVARAVGRASATTVQYLVEFIQREGIEEPSPWLAPDEFRRIVEAADRVHTRTPKSIFDALNGQIPYDQIRIAAACLRNRS